ncbi:ROK family protein [Xenorhabdus bovienii]|uniref:ROK family protein n=1 Tax=Xenorhabdus bovienii TaxID=40576 RepID=UPI00237CF1BB|nr:ROK family protein [Xenorhabdus bovienii]MDE9479682.1 ROK family protein [Xenorhabdus bovienii]MDE9532601.1 ROK family protein [Xenorhabdus bovienii]
MFMNESHQTYIYDVGGTFLRNAEWISSKGPVNIKKDTSPSFLKYPYDDVISLKNRLIESILEKLPTYHNGLTVSISLGAALNHHTGEVYGAAPLWGACQVNFKLLDELYSLRPDIRWMMMNDVTAMAIHFSTQPICQNIHKAMLITVSSGIACRIFETMPFRVNFNVSGLQGEIGHLPGSSTSFSLDCDCGGSGHIAAYASGRGIRNVYDYMYQRKYQTGPNYTNFEQEFKLGLERNDEFCNSVLAIAMKPLADLITSVLVIDPSIEIIALSGGVIDSLSNYVKRALLSRILKSGPYMTFANEYRMIENLLYICPSDTASGLWGAGVATTFANNPWFVRHIPQKGPN